MKQNPLGCLTAKRIKRSSKISKKHNQGTVTIKASQKWRKRSLSKQMDHAP